MKINKELKERLKLTKTDVAILKLLDKSTLLNPIKIAELIEISRTTVNYRLNILKKQGLCILVKEKNIAWWKINRQSLLYLVANVHNEESKKEFKGIQEFGKRLLYLSNTVTVDRIYVIEPSEQTKYFFTNSDKVNTELVNNNLKDNNVVVEALVGSSTLSLVKGVDKKSKESMFGRMTVSYEVRDDILNFDECIIIADNSIYFFNYKKISGTEIHNQIVAQNYRKIFEFYKQFGKRVDFNKILKEK